MIGLDAKVLRVSENFKRITSPDEDFGRLDLSDNLDIAESISSGDIIESRGGFLHSWSELDPNNESGPILLFGRDGSGRSVSFSWDHENERLEFGKQSEGRVDIIADNIFGTWAGSNLNANQVNLQKLFAGNGLIGDSYDGQSSRIWEVNPNLKIDTLTALSSITSEGALTVEGAGYFDDDLTVSGSLETYDLKILSGSQGLIVEGDSLFKKPVKISSTSFPGENLFTVEGSHGILFSIRDSYEGGIVTFSDISGLPVFEIEDDLITSHRDFHLNGTLVAGNVPWDRITDAPVYTKTEIDDIVDGIVEGDIDLTNYYTKIESDSRFFSVNGGIVSGSIEVEESSLFNEDLFVEGLFSTASNVIRIGDVGSPSDITANGGGIILSGGASGDKTILYSHERWRFSEGITVNGNEGIHVINGGGSASNTNFSLIAWGDNESDKRMDWYANSQSVQFRDGLDDSLLRIEARIDAENVIQRGNLIQGSGTHLSGTLNNRLLGSGDVTISHASGSWSPKNALSNAYVISNLSVDNHGHITDWTTRELELDDLSKVDASGKVNNSQLRWNNAQEKWEAFLPPSIGDGELSLSTGVGLSGSGVFSANQSGNATFSVEIASGYKLPTTSEWDDKLEEADLNIDNWDEAYAQRGSVIAGTDLDWSNGQLHVGDAVARLNSPVFTGTPTTTKPNLSDNTTRIPTTSWVRDWVISQGYITEQTDPQTLSWNSNTGDLSISNGNTQNLDGRYLNLSGGTLTGQLILPASTTTEASLRIPHGVAPTSPTNGDFWTTTTSLVGRINGTTRTFYHTGNLATVSQSEAETGTATSVRAWTSQRVRQAVSAYSYSKAETGNLVEDSRPVDLEVTGTSTKTITLTLGDDTELTASFTDNNTIYSVISAADIANPSHTTGSLITGQRINTWGDSKYEPIITRGNVVGSGIATITNGVGRVIDSDTLTVTVPGTNLGVSNRTTTTLDVTSSTGSNATIPAATTTYAGLLTSSDKSKLDGIESGANKYTHPTGFSNQPSSVLSGSSVISRVRVNNEGHVIGVDTRGLYIGNLEDVNVIELEDREILIWNDGVGLWENGVLNFADLGTTPSTLAGYGITDAYTQTEINTKLDAITSGEIDLQNYYNKSETEDLVYDVKPTNLNVTGTTTKTVTLTLGDNSTLTASFNDNDTIYVHDTGFTNQPATKLTGAFVVDQVEVNNEGHVTGVSSRELTPGNIGLGNVENKSSATIRSEITSSNITAALGFTPEPSFTKNTAFNKNFGTGADDVARGNHTHSWSQITGKPTLDNYVSWKLKAETGDAGTDIESGEEVVFVGGGGLTVERLGNQISYDVDNTIARVSQLHDPITLDNSNADYLKIDGQDLTTEKIDLASHVTGLLPLGSVAGLEDRLADIEAGDIDLTNYYTKIETDGFLSDKADRSELHDPVSVTGQSYITFNASTQAITVEQVNLSGTHTTGNLHWDRVSNKPSTYTPSSHSLDGHSNVNLTSISDGELLVRSGNNWINRTLSEAGIASTSDLQNGLATKQDTIPYTTENVANKGEADGYAPLDSNKLVPLTHLPDISKQATYVVANETERNNLDTSIEGTKAFQKDTDEMFIWDGTGWHKISDPAWENINLDWTNIINPPTFDNYNHWKLGINSASTINVNSTDTVRFVAGDNVTLSRSGTSITINSSFNDTTYDTSNLPELNEGTNTTGKLQTAKNLNDWLVGKNYYVTPTGTTSQYVRGDGSLANFPNIPQGTVTSIGMTVPTGLSVTPTTITSTGTFNISLASGYKIPTVSELNDKLEADDVGDGTLSLKVGLGLTGNATFSANQKNDVTFTVGVSPTHVLPTIGEWNSKLTATNQDKSNWDNAYSRSVTGFTGSGNGNVTIERQGESNLTLDLAHTHTFASLTSKPSTISGYGITDSYTKSEIDSKIDDITSGDIDLQNYYNKAESDERFGRLDFSNTWEDTNTFEDETTTYGLTVKDFLTVESSSLFQAPVVISNTSLPGETLFKVEGSHGVLFSIRDSYEDGIVSFNDISGLPVLEIKDDVIKLHRDTEITGNLNLTGNVRTTGDIRGNNLTSDGHSYLHSVFVDGEVELISGLTVTAGDVSIGDDLIVEGDLGVDGSVNVVGRSTSWGNTGGTLTQGLNVSMGTGSSATWLLTGYSGNEFRAGLQVLDSNGTTRLYLGNNAANYVEFSYLGDIGNVRDLTASKIVATDSIPSGENSTTVATTAWVKAQGYITSQTDSQTLSWNSSNGELSISNGNTISLDGRYALSANQHDPVTLTNPSNVSFLSFNESTQSLTVSKVKNADLDNSSLTVSPGTGLTGGGSVSLGSSTTLNVDTSVIATRAWVESQDYLTEYTDTKYTAGDGLTLTETEFSLPVTTSGSGTFVKAVTQTATGINIELGTPPDTNTTYSLITTNALDAGTETTGRTISASRLVYWGSITAGENIAWNPTTRKYDAVDTTYETGTLAQLNAGSDTTGRLQTAKNLNDWIDGKGFITSYDDTVTRIRGTTSGSYESGDITLLAGSNVSISQSGKNITINATDTNTTYSLISTSEIDNGSTTSRLISGNRLRHFGNTIAGTGLSWSSNQLNVQYGTTSGTAAQGNDSRINNGQTAFDWGNHAEVGYLTSETTYGAGTGLSLDSNNNFNLTNTGVSSGNYGSNVEIPTITVDAQGRITSASNTTIRNASATQSGLVSTGTQTFAGGKTFNDRIDFRDRIGYGNAGSQRQFFYASNFSQSESSGTEIKIGEYELTGSSMNYQLSGEVMLGSTGQSTIITFNLHTRSHGTGVDSIHYFTQDKVIVGSDRGYLRAYIDPSVADGRKVVLTFVLTSSIHDYGWRIWAKPRTNYDIFVPVTTHTVFDNTGYVEIFENTNINTEVNKRTTFNGRTTINDDLIVDGDVTADNLNIADWDTAYSQSHTHDQNLNTTDTPTFKGVNLSDTETSTIKRLLYLTNNQTGNGTGASIDFGFSTTSDYEHASIRASRTNLNGTHASQIELLARPAQSGAGTGYLNPLLVVGYDNNIPFIKLNGLTTVDSDLVVSGGINVELGDIYALGFIESDTGFKGNGSQITGISIDNVTDLRDTLDAIVAGDVSINANDLTGDTLASNVVNSSLTSVGTLTTLKVHDNNNDNSIRGQTIIHDSNALGENDTLLTVRARNAAPHTNSTLLKVGTSGASNWERFIVKTNGNVLIGTTNDTGERLQVNGKIKASDDIDTSGSLLANGLSIYGAATISQSLSVTQNITGGTITSNGALNVDGIATFDDDVDVLGNLETYDVLIRDSVNGLRVEADSLFTKPVRISNTSLPGETLFSVEGSNGVLFSVRDSYEDGIVSFNDISGLPVMSLKDSGVVIHRSETIKASTEPDADPDGIVTFVTKENVSGGVKWTKWDKFPDGSKTVVTQHVIPN